jgi:DNA-binding MarR family transcriptional regulator
MKPEETIDFHIRKLWSRIARIYNSEAAKYGGSMAIGQILLNVEPQGTPSTKLGPKMGMESRSLVRTLQAMEEAGLIKRIACQDDKRVVRIHLTPKGKQMRDVSRETVIKFNQRVQEEISAKDLENFHAVMDKLNDLLERKELLT